MKRGEIAVLAALFIPITLGTIVWATIPVLPFLVMLAMDPGCTEGPVADSDAINARGDVVEGYIKVCTGIWNNCR